MSDFKQIKHRANLPLKGQLVNSWETPQFVTAYHDRIVLLKHITLLESAFRKLYEACEAEKRRCGVVPVLRPAMNDPQVKEVFASLKGVKK